MPLSPRAIAYIEAHFPFASVPGVPEVRVRKAGPESGLWRLAEIEGEELSAPYWSSWWGGGIALARHVLDHPETVAGKRVLDLGCGSGLVGIATAMAGAAGVIALDIDPFAIAVARMNAAENGASVETRLGDLRSLDPLDVDVVLAGDVFYDAHLAAHSLIFLDRCLGRGQHVLVGDPGRAHLPREKLRLIAEYDGADFAQPHARVSVFAFE
jgi:predicted nicotinamide N-methyase